MVPESPGWSLSVGMSVNCPDVTEMTLCGFRPMFLNVTFVPGLTFVYWVRNELSTTWMVMAALPVWSTYSDDDTFGSGVVDGVDELPGRH